MDAERFDGLVRILGSDANRRRVLGALAGSVVAVLGGGQVTRAQGNSGCAAFCKEVFGPGRQRGQCISAAARGDAGSLCAACEADPDNICVGEDGEPTCDCAPVGLECGAECVPGDGVNPCGMVCPNCSADRTDPENVVFRCFRTD
jgi:hypothetical protein